MLSPATINLDKFSTTNRSWKTEMSSKNLYSNLNNKWFRCEKNKKIKQTRRLRMKNKRKTKSKTFSRRKTKLIQHIL